MRKKILQTALALAVANLVAYKDMYDEGLHIQQSDTKPRPTPKKSQPKKEQYFVIKCKQIMATSRKDAIKRYNHQYKRK